MDKLLCYSGSKPIFMALQSETTDSILVVSWTRFVSRDDFVNMPNVPWKTENLWKCMYLARFGIYYRSFISFEPDVIIFNKTCLWWPSSLVRKVVSGGKDLVKLIHLVHNAGLINHTNLRYRTTRMMYANSPTIHLDELSFIFRVVILDVVGITPISYIGSGAYTEVTLHVYI